MRITEKKEVVHTEIKDVTVKRICDCCGEEIVPDPILSTGLMPVYNFFHVTTGHHDWGYESIDSIETYDACSAECAEEMVRVYLAKAKNNVNTMYIEIRHVRCLEDGTDRDYPRKITE